MTMVSFRPRSEQTRSPLISTSTRDPPLEMWFGRGRTTHFAIPARFLPTSARDKNAISPRALFFHSTRRTPKNPLSGGSWLCSLPTRLGPTNQMSYINTVFAVWTNHDKVIIIKQAFKAHVAAIRRRPHLLPLRCSSAGRENGRRGKFTLRSDLSKHYSLHLQKR